MLSKLYGNNSRAGSGAFETFSWYYFRISGVVLLFMVIIHLLVMHVTNDVATTTYSFIAARYSNPLWRLFDWTLLTLTLTHGMNGLRVVIDDYVRHPRTRIILLSLAALALFVFLLYGTITLVTFQPVAGWQHTAPTMHQK